MPTTRNSTSSPPNSNLYCGQCDSQIGILNNEWVHLTSSYAQPKEKGTTFGTEIGDKTQVVPNGSAQKIAEGCLMAEVYCKKCSTMVAQHCKSAPSANKEHLVDQQWFKLSRIYLKDAKTSERMEPSFVDGDVVPSQYAGSVRSSIVPKRQAPAVDGGSEAPQLAQVQQPQIEPQDHGVGQPSTAQESFLLPAQPQEQATFQQPRIQMSPVDQVQHLSVSQHMTPPGHFQHATTSQQLSYPVQQAVAYNHQQYLYNNSIPDHFRPMSAGGAPNFSREMAEQGVAIADCFNRITVLSGRVSSEALKTMNTDLRLASIEAKVHSRVFPPEEYQKRLTKVEGDIVARTINCTKHQQTIQQQSSTINEQREQLKGLTTKLESLQQNMAELRNLMEENQSRSLLYESQKPDSHDFLENLEAMVHAMRGAESNDEEMVALKEENKAMKARLKSIASVMGEADREDLALEEDTTLVQDSEDLQILGKRKRNTKDTVEQPRKVSRRRSDAASLHEEPGSSLPTPDSTRHELASTKVSQTRTNGTKDIVEEGADREARPTELDPHDDEHFVMVIDDDEEVTEIDPSFDTETASGLREIEPAQDDVKNSTNHNGSKTSSMSRALVPIDSRHAHQAHVSQAGSPHDGQMGYLSQHQHPFFGNMNATPYYTPYPPAPPYSTPSPYPFQHHQGFNSQVPNPRFANGPGAMPTYYGATIFPPSMPNSSYPNVIQAGINRNDSSSGNRSFSDTLDRGQRLKEITQQPGQPPESTTKAPITQQEPHARSRGSAPGPGAGPSSTPSSTLQPRDVNVTVSASGTNVARGMNLSATKTGIHASRITEITGNAESIDFSDEENNAPTTSANTSSTQASRPASTRPASPISLPQPRVPSTDGASPRPRLGGPRRPPGLITFKPAETPQSERFRPPPQSQQPLPARETSRRLADGILGASSVALEPLQRPVPIEPKPHRKNTESQKAPEIPQSPTADQNSNDSAAGQGETPPTGSPSLPIVDTAHDDSTGRQVKKSRKSEPIARVTLHITKPSGNHSSAEHSKGSSAKNKLYTLAPRPQVIASKPVSSSDGVRSVGDASLLAVGPTKMVDVRPNRRSSDAGSRTNARSTTLLKQLKAKDDSDKSDDNHDNEDVCAKCKKRGNLLCCDGCPKSFHHRCIDPPISPKQKIKGDWYCPRCVQEQRERALKTQLSEQVLIERNRLAREAMDRE